MTKRPILRPATWLVILVMLTAGCSDADEARSDDGDGTEHVADGDDPSGAGDDSDAEATTTEAETTTTVPTTTTTAAPTTTTTEPPPEPVVLEGSGDSVVDFEHPEPGVVWWATISYDGGGNFAVWELDDQLEQLDLLVNEIGSYSGNVAIGLRGDTAGFEVTAAGPWRIEAKPQEMLRPFDTEVSGTGDDVVAYLGDPMAAHITHTGESNFAVHSERDLLVNEIGNYEGTVRFPGGPALVRITADGPWTIEPGA